MRLLLDRERTLIESNADEAQAAIGPYYAKTVHLAVEP